LSLTLNISTYRIQLKRVGMSHADQLYCSILLYRCRPGPYAGFFHQGGSKGLIPRRRNSSHEIVRAKCRNMMDGCTWVILLNLHSFFAFAVSRTDFYSLAKRNFFSRSLIYLYCACTISYRAKYFAFRREKALVESGFKDYMPKNVSNTQRIINNVILKIGNIALSKREVAPCSLSRCIRPWCRHKITFTPCR
jgi:hypothetical protein